MVLKVLYRDVSIWLPFKFKFVLLDCPVVLLFVQNSTFSSDKLLQPNPGFALSNKSFVTEFIIRKKYHSKTLKITFEKDWRQKRKVFKFRQIYSHTTCTRPFRNISITHRDDKDIEGLCRCILRLLLTKFSHYWRMKQTTKTNMKAQKGILAKGYTKWTLKEQHSKHLSLARQNWTFAFESWNVERAIFSLFK